MFRFVALFAAARLAAAAPKSPREATDEKLIVSAQKFVDEIQWAPADGRRLVMIVDLPNWQVSMRDLTHSSTFLIWQLAHPRGRLSTCR